MLAKNSWQPLVWVIIQVNAADVGYYPLPKLMDVLLSQGAPPLVPASAENVPEVAPMDPENAAPADVPSPSFPLSLDSLADSPILPPEIIPGSLANGSIPNIFNEILKNPGKGMASVAENMSAFLRDKLPGNTLLPNTGNPIDFTVLIEGVQKALENMGQNKECEHGLTVIDQFLYTSKALIGSVNALQKLTETWRKINVNNLVQCFTSPGLLPGIGIPPAIPIPPVPLPGVGNDKA